MYFHTANLIKMLAVIPGCWGAIEPYTIYHRNIMTLTAKCLTLYTDPTHNTELARSTSYLVGVQDCMNISRMQVFTLQGDICHRAALEGWRYLQVPHCHTISASLD